MNVSLFYSHRIFFQKSRKMIKGKMAGIEKKKKNRKCSKSLFPVAYLKIPHYFLDIVSIEMNASKKVGNLLLEFWAVRKHIWGLSPQIFIYINNPLEISETMGMMTDVIWDVCLQCSCYCQKHKNYGGHNTRKNRMQSLGFKILKSI